MRRGLIYLPLAGLVAAVAGIGLLLGGRAATKTETEVIARVAGRYVAEAGPEAGREDCHARPAQSEGLWLVVICETESGTGIEYFIDRFGRVADARRIEARG